MKIKLTKPSTFFRPEFSVLLHAESIVSVEDEGDFRIVQLHDDRRVPVKETVEEIQKLIHPDPTVSLPEIKGS